MVPGKNTLALRQYRAEGRDRWAVHRWHDAVPALLQISLVLFFCGLIDFSWHTSRGITAITISTLSAALGVFLFITIMPLVNSQCPYRSLPSWVALFIWRWFCRMVRIVGTSFIRGFDASFRRESDSDVSDRPVIPEGLANVTSWDFFDRKRMSDAVQAESYALKTIVEVVKKQPTIETLEYVTAAVGRVDQEHMSIPMPALWTLLRGLFAGFRGLESQQDASQQLKGFELYVANGPLTPRFCRYLAYLVGDAISSPQNFPGSDKKARSLVSLLIDFTCLLAKSENSVYPIVLTMLARIMSAKVPDDYLVRLAAERMLDIASETEDGTNQKVRWNLPDGESYVATTTPHLPRLDADDYHSRC
jgi:hypothetical protein